MRGNDQLHLNILVEIAREIQHRPEDCPLPPRMQVTLDLIEQHDDPLRRVFSQLLRCLFVLAP
jgi:hypothetical protein